MVSETHRSVLRSSLAVIEKHLETMLQECARDSVKKAILYRVVDDLRDHQKRQLQSVVGHMLKELRVIKDRFSLDSRDESVALRMRALLAEIWTILQDSRPEKISKAYGVMSQSDQNLLRPHILNLLKYANLASDLLAEDEGK